MRPGAKLRHRGDSLSGAGFPECSATGGLGKYYATLVAHGNSAAAPSGGAAELVDDAVHQRFDEDGVVAFTHDADHRLGA